MFQESCRKEGNILSFYKHCYMRFTSGLEMSMTNSFKINSGGFGNTDCFTEILLL